MWMRKVACRCGETLIVKGDVVALNSDYFGSGG
jgi:hypothetical protein